MMKKYARLEGTKVAELLETDGDISKMYHPDLVWVQCNDIDVISIGWNCIDGIFTPPSGPTLQKAAEDKLKELTDDYRQAVQADIAYTSTGGVTQIFQADTDSVSDLTSMLLAFSGTAIVPEGFYWKSSDNTHVPFVFADLQGLARVIGAAGFAQFVALQELKAQVAEAVSTGSMQRLQSVVWPTNTGDAQEVTDV